MLLRLVLLSSVLFINISKGFDLIKDSEKCTDINNEPLTCPSNWIYYFECCAKECCLRTQLLPAIVISVIALIMSICCILSCIAYCCCGE